MIIRPRIMLAVVLLAFAPLSAHAADAPVKATGDVELPPILAPMVVSGRLQGYAYITIALTPVSREIALTIREKQPFLQDAFLREVNKGSIVKPDDAKVVDTVATKTRLMGRLNQILPPNSVSDLKFQSIVYAAVKPES